MKNQGIVIALAAGVGLWLLSQRKSEAAVPFAKVSFPTQPSMPDLWVTYAQAEALRTQGALTDLAYEQALALVPTGTGASDYQTNAWWEGI